MHLGGPTLNGNPRRRANEAPWCHCWVAGSARRRSKRGLPTPRANAKCPQPPRLTRAPAAPRARARRGCGRRAGCWRASAADQPPGCGFVRRAPTVGVACGAARAPQRASIERLRECADSDAGIRRRESRRRRSSWRRSSPNGSPVPAGALPVLDDRGTAATHQRTRSCAIASRQERRSRGRRRDSAATAHSAQTLQWHLAQGHPG
jgi:hypothetical protein